MKLPGFELIEEIGQGGMATVWKARQVSLDRTVAIKVLSSRMAHDPADTDGEAVTARPPGDLRSPIIRLAARRHRGTIMTSTQ